MDPKDSRLKILYVIDSLAPGGAERSLAALAPHYVELGVELEVAVLIDRNGLEDEVRAAGASVVSLGAASNRAQRVRRIASLARERRPDLVHTTLFESDISGRIGARLAGVPVVSSVVNEAYGPEHAAEPGVRVSRLRAAQGLDAATARLAVRLHAVSEQVRRVMAARLHYPVSRIDVVGRGRDLGVMGHRTPARRAMARGALGVTDEETVVLSVARHEPQKALEGLIEALSQTRATLPTVRLFIAGREGNATLDLRRHIERLGLENAVTLLGERADVPDLLCASDVFVLPSRREGMPGAVIEAMALEAPIVASDLPQVREVTGDAAALLVAVDDVRGFAEAIVQCRRDPDATAARVADAHARFLRYFTIEQTSRQMIGFYRRALGGRGPSLS